MLCFCQLWNCRISNCRTWCSYWVYVSFELVVQHCSVVSCVKYTCVWSMLAVTHAHCMCAYSHAYNCRSCNALCACYAATVHSIECVCVSSFKHTLTLTQSNHYLIPHSLNARFAHLWCFLNDFCAVYNIFTISARRPSHIFLTQRNVPELSSRIFLRSRDS